MKTCPNCQTELENNFDICWKCQFSFIDDKVLNENDYRLVCPGCRTVVEDTMHFCPVCRFDLSKYQMVKKKVDEKLVNCIHCNVPLFLLRRFDFQEGIPMGALTNRESFDLYACPRCRKVEFYLPE